MEGQATREAFYEHVEGTRVINREQVGLSFTLLHFCLLAAVIWKLLEVKDVTWAEYVISLENKIKDAAL